MINLGVRAHDFGKLTLEELADAIARHGFSCIQLAVNKALKGAGTEPGMLSPGFAVHVREVLKSRGISIAVLGCYINPIHPDPALREKGLQRFEEHLAFAHDFGCTVVATETGSCHPACAYHPDTETEEAFQDLVGVVKRLVKVAERFSVFVGIEGVADQHTIGTYQRMVRLLELVDSPNLRVVYDPVNFIPHDRLTDHAALLDQAFELFGERMVAIHAKDFKAVDGKKQGDLPAGAGVLDYQRLFTLIRQHKPWIQVLLENTQPETVAETAGFIRAQYRQVLAKDQLSS